MATKTAVKSKNTTKKKPTKTKSGKYWVTWANQNAKNSKLVSKLNSDFKKKYDAFSKALTDAGATIKIKSTKRHKNRAYLFHWCWKISLGKLSTTKISNIPKQTGVNIEWDHGDDKKSKAAAKEMRVKFGLATPTSPKPSKVAPSLSSNHIAGKAIDIEITWTGKIKVQNKSGKKVEITYMTNVKKNKKLHAIGKSYGVIKHLTDTPHWSHTGR